MYAKHRVVGNGYALVSFVIKLIVEQTRQEKAKREVKRETWQKERKGFRDNRRVMKEQLSGNKSDVMYHVRDHRINSDNK